MGEQGRCTQCFSLDVSIKKLLFYEEKNVLVTITDTLMLTQHAVFGEMDTKEILKVRTLSVLPFDSSFSKHFPFMLKSTRSKLAKGGVFRF